MEEVAIGYGFQCNEIKHIFRQKVLEVFFWFWNFINQFIIKTAMSLYYKPL